MKFLRLLSFSILAVLLTSCLDVDYEMDFKTDGSGIVKLNLNIDTIMASLINPDIDLSNIETDLSSDNFKKALPKTIILNSGKIEVGEDGIAKGEYNLSFKNINDFNLIDLNSKIKLKSNLDNAVKYSKII